MKKYDKYKDSGIEWIGEIPEHWEIIRLGIIGIFSSSGIDKKILDNEPFVKIINYTDVYGNHQLTLDSKKDYMIVTTPQSKFNEHLVKKGDLIFTPSSETSEDIGLSAVVIEDLNDTAYSYHVLRYQFHKNIDINFKKYLCNNYFVLNHFSKCSQGTTRQTLGRNDFKNTVVVIPSSSEQTAIANYLDRKTAEIDELITDKKRLLELYEEEKTAIINQAVTKGINPSVKMKDSGIEWLGNIPEHWEVKRLKVIARVQTGRTPKIQNSQVDYFENGDINWFTPADFEKNNELIDSKRKINWNAIEKNEVELFPGYSVYLVSIGATLGRVSFFRNKASANQQINIITFDTRFNPLFGYYFLIGNKEMITLEADYTTLPILNQSKTKALQIAVPPLFEQESIVNNIEEECSRIDAKKVRTQKLIDLLSEYRTALISEVVTGKVKVISDFKTT